MLVSPPVSMPKVSPLEDPLLVPEKKHSYNSLLLSVCAECLLLVWQRWTLLEVPCTIDRHNKSRMLLIDHPHKYNIRKQH